jgi:hypothetical protein
MTPKEKGSVSLLSAGFWANNAGNDNKNKIKWASFFIFISVFIKK